ncbi:ZF-HD homeobox protein [Acorus calamus]|uniref:ZF-HD homeobox protein n=1 Tax=Acorus calamus TaxID=4465 RepID=A0AAV9DJ80_ACOCL|nr:ZF-HD homeobox protein [Acorus calamus]
MVACLCERNNIMDLSLVPYNAQEDKKSKPSDHPPIRYRECMRNHAASIGGHAYDGCGEFMSGDGDDSPFKCAVCGCHRNFHRKAAPAPLMMPMPLMYHQHLHRRERSEETPPATPTEMMSRRKRYRTRFTAEQKEKMQAFGERVGWRIQKHDDVALEQFCVEVGVKRHVLKVWMHNNKNNYINISTSDKEEGLKNNHTNNTTTNNNPPPSIPV